MTSRSRNRRGFTLVELMTGMLVIAVLVLIALPRFRSAQEKAWRAAMRSDLKNLANQQELKHKDILSYTADLDVLEFTQSEGVTVTVNQAEAEGWAATAEHQALPDEQCGIYQGTADASGGEPATRAGVVTCTFDETVEDAG